MALFVIQHLLQDQLRLPVFSRQCLEMGAQVRGHALLGRMNKTEAHLVPCQRCGCPQGIGGCVEKWVEPAGCSIQLVQSRLTPRQMISFFLCCAQQVLPRVVGACYQSLPLIERLGADLAGVIHSHQPRRMCPLARTQLRFLVPCSRGGPWVC